MVSARIVVLLATLLCAAAAVASSWEDDNHHHHGGHKSGQCVRRCEDRPWHQRPRCLEQCREEEREKRQERSRHEADDRSGEGSSEDEREQEKEKQKDRRPYVFDRRSFRRVVRSEQGSLRVLRPFDEVSRLLRGIRDYRVAVLEANPRSFVVPSHTDAHCICYVAEGEGVVTTIENGERRSYTIKQGHVFVAPAGAVTYLANTDGRKKLVITKILHTISVPGEFQFFFGPGGRNPESFLSSFSKSIQRAAYKTSSDRLERLFGRHGQDKGIIVRATEEQTRELRRHASEGGHGPHWPLPPFGESRGPYSLLDQRPSIANQHGQLYEADARSFHDLAEHDVSVSFANITAGSMSAPLFNTRSFKIAYVPNGKGYAEIVCPHRQSQGGESERERDKGRRSEEEEEESSEEQEEAGQGYHTIRARLSPGTAFVVPAGHPFVAVASRDSNLQIVCFEVHADRNEKVFLAGADNVLQKLDRVAKALSFASKAEEVDEVLGSRREKGFLPGPEESGGHEEREQEEEEREERHGGRGERERHGREEREKEEEREGRHGGREEREEEERHGRGRREEVAETLMRMVTARM
uniref:Vicilin-like embryo storage protein n=3 Tax=Zea mays TaxID=4577 RepID=Q03865_MAIZE|nr:vicilin-like embryo storage protein [Zea mays]